MRPKLLNGAEDVKKAKMASGMRIASDRNPNLSQYAVIQKMHTVLLRMGHCRSIL